MLNWLDFQPILVIAAVPNQKGIRFLRHDKQLDINTDMAEIVWAILAQCNGYRAATEIAELSGVDEVTTKGILTELHNLGVIIDSRKQYLHFHKLSGNPAPYLRYLTPEQVRAHATSHPRDVKSGTVIDFEIDTNSVLYAMQMARKSCRSFSNEKLTLSQIGNICDYAYSLSRHAVPSGGGLYPLKIYCLVVRDQDGITKGYYEYVTSKGFLLQFEKEPDIEQLKYCFNDETLAFNSPIQIIIAADLDRQSYKYSNRGYRLTLIEAGQVAQNICIYCEEKKFVTCELGGLLDEALMAELGIAEDGIYPLLGIAIGKPSNQDLFSFSEFLEKLEEQFVGEDKPIKSYGVDSFRADNASFFGAWSKYGNCEHEMAGATATSYFEAACKAIIEGYERYCSGQICHKSFPSTAYSGAFIAPSILAPLEPSKAIARGLQPYNVGDEINWTEGYMGTDTVFVPTDLVFYGHPNTKLYYGNSSGTAAFSNYRDAQDRALIELIERDALMRGWYEQKSPKRIAYDALPTHAKKRVKCWKEKGREVHILDMDSPYRPVFLVVIVSKKYPCFVSGAAALIGHQEATINKALQEAEYNLLLAIQYPKKPPPELEQVKSPTDHGHFYHFAKNAKKIEWLWNGTEITTMPSVNCNLDELRKKLDVIYVDISYASSPIKVVRALCPQLIPISFGYGLDYYLHPEVQKLNFSPNSRDLPHYFA